MISKSDAKKVVVRAEVNGLAALVLMEQISPETLQKEIARLRVEAGDDAELLKKLDQVSIVGHSWPSGHIL